MCLDCTISIGDIFAAITGIAMAIFAFLQYRINKRQAEHQHTTTAIDYCKQLMEFFDACETKWEKIKVDAQKEIQESFEKAMQEQKDGVPAESQKEIAQLIGNRDFFYVAVKICPFLRLTGTEFQVFLNRLSGYAMQCSSHMIYVLKGIQKIDLNLLNYHQVLMIENRIYRSAPSFAYYFDCICQQIEDVEKNDPFIDGWRDTMKKRLSFLSDLSGDISGRAMALSELYSDDCAPAEKETIKKKFAEKTWDESKLWSHF